jgi:hypothetical protein
VRFHRPVRGLEPLGAIRHAELTLTVAEVDAFAVALSSTEAAILPMR